MEPTKPPPPIKQKHPIGLRVIFFTEMWERFGFYGMLCIFTLYLHYHLHIPKGQAAGIYGIYSSASYFTSIIGGFLADRYLGYRRSVLIGAAFLSIGYLLLGLASSEFTFLTPTLRSICLYSSIYGLLIIGQGLFKPNQTTLVGNLYEQGDPRKDTAFNIFYMAINIGAFVSPIIACVIGLLTGSWSLIFTVCGIGMAIGFTTFALFKHHLADADRPSRGSIKQVVEDKRETPKVERQRIRALLIMCAIVITFWMAFQQNNSTLNFWAVQNTNMSFIPAISKLQEKAKEEEKKEQAFKEELGEKAFQKYLLTHPQPLTTQQSQELKKKLTEEEIENYVPQQFTEVTQKRVFYGILYESVNPLFIVIFTPLIIGIFTFLRKRNKEPSTPTKLTIGMLLTAVAYGIMVIASYVGGDRHGLVEGVVSPLWLVFSYMVITMGELCLSPMGLSMVTKLAPKRMLSMMFGFWQLSTSIGLYLAGKIGNWWDVWPHHRFFGFLVITSLISAFLLFIQLGTLKKAMPPETHK